jgi:hypothetical protein
MDQIKILMSLEDSGIKHPSSRFLIKIRFHGVSEMSFGRDFSNFSFFIKKHLDIFDRQVFYKLAVLTAIIIILVIFLALIF